MTDERWMEEAIGEAYRALHAGEVPIGAIVLRNGSIIGRGHNEIEERSSVAAHAELIAIGEAGRTLGDWRLDGCTVYVTVEPCHMCFGAFYLARVARVVFGAREKRSGSCGSVDRFHEARLFSHRIEVTGGVREVECLTLMQEFFAGLRGREKRRRDARAG